LLLVEKNIPGFTDLIAFKELGTPLTIEHFTGRYHGSLYGVPATPMRYESRFLQAETDIKNLFLCGSDAASLGIMGALLGGVAAASRATGNFGFFKLMKYSKKTRKKRLRLSDSADLPDTGTKIETLLIEKEPAGGSVFRLVFRLPGFIKLYPGQHIKLKVAEFEWRAYSLAEIDEGKAALLIDTKFKGTGSNLVKSLNIGDRLTIRIPLTDYIFNSQNRDIIFFATSVGLAPIVSILGHLKKTGYKGRLKLFFGAPSEADIFVKPLLAEYEKNLEFEIVYCVDTPSDNKDLFSGYVTDAFIKQNLNVDSFDYYLCGNPFMVQNTVNMLKQKGASKVFW
jgi:NAD(P)H-flavin reductase